MEALCRPWSRRSRRRVSARGARTADTALLDWLHARAAASRGKADLSFASLLPGSLPDWPAGRSDGPADLGVLSVREHARHGPRDREAGARGARGGGALRLRASPCRTASPSGSAIPPSGATTATRWTARTTRSIRRGRRGAASCFLRRDGRAVARRRRRSRSRSTPTARRAAAATPSGGCCPRVSESGESLRDLLIADARRRGRARARSRTRTGSWRRRCPRADSGRPEPALGAAALERDDVGGGARHPSRARRRAPATAPSSAASRRSISRRAPRSRGLPRPGARAQDAAQRGARRSSVERSSAAWSASAASGRESGRGPREREVLATPAEPSVAARGRGRLWRRGPARASRRCAARPRRDGNRGRGSSFSPGATRRGEGARRAAARVCAGRSRAVRARVFPARVEARGRFRREQPEARDAREHRRSDSKARTSRDARASPGAPREPPIAPPRAPRRRCARATAPSSSGGTRLILPSAAGRLPEPAFLRFPEGVRPRTGRYYKKIGNAVAFKRISHRLQGGPPSRSQNGPL